MPVASGAGGQVAGIGQSNTRPTPNIDYQAPPDLTTGGSQSGSGSASAVAQVEQANARDTAAIDYDRPPDLGSGSASDGATNTTSGSSDSTTWGSFSGGDGKTVGEALMDHNLSRDPVGDVAECTSFSEVVADMATSVRDAIVNAAASRGCSALAGQVVGSSAWQNMKPSDVDDPAFQEALLIEVYKMCVAGTSAEARIPDAMVDIWNQKIAQGGWATIGPRRLVVGETHYGDLRAPGDRKFISSDPLGHYGSTVKMRLVEQGGKARVTARICTVSLDNDYELVDQKEINPTQADRQNEKQEFSTELNAPFRFLIVYLNAHGTPDRHFKYELTPLPVITTD